MLNRVLCAALLAGCPFTVAQAGAWSFAYQGFYDSQTELFEPDHMLVGYFEARDDNANGTVDAAELTQLRIDNQSYLGCGAPTTCAIETFAYVPGSNTLTFTVARFVREDEGVATQVIIAGDSISITSADHNYMAQWRWTEATTLHISPVPEPASAAMLGLGLLLVARRRFTRR